MAAAAAAPVVAAAAPCCDYLAARQPIVQQLDITHV